MLTLPTPHGDKLVALLSNQKLPKSDASRVERAVKRYMCWITKLQNSVGSSDNSITAMISLLNEYKRYIDLEVIFDSENDFLYRQKGQLKLDNSIIEEFLPILVIKTLKDSIQHLQLSFGPTRTFSSLRFEEDMRKAQRGGGINVRSKDQDFAISRKLFIRTSHHPDFADAVTLESNIAYIASEIKTNLDKTMFQEAAATALDLKSVVPGARYYLLCEWLDMTPISTATTAIDEILILRRAKRLPSNIRSGFAASAGRRASRKQYQDYLIDHPLSPQPFVRLLAHIKGLISQCSEEDVVTRGYF